MKHGEHRGGSLRRAQGKLAHHKTEIHGEVVYSINERRAAEMERRLEEEREHRE
jgi:hypothetical protein